MLFEIGTPPTERWGIFFCSYDTSDTVQGPESRDFVWQICVDLYYEPNKFLTRTTGGSAGKFL